MYTASLGLSRHSAAIFVKPKFISDADSLSFVVLTSGVWACDRLSCFRSYLCCPGKLSMRDALLSEMIFPRHEIKFFCRLSLELCTSTRVQGVTWPSVAFSNDLCSSAMTRVQCR